MNPHDVILTGVPRSGTTLVCNLLNRLPDTLALHEPMKLRPLARLDDRTRQSILTEGRAFTKHVGGQVPDNPYANQIGNGNARKLNVERGEIFVAKSLSHEFTLCVKHPAAFTALLDALAPRFACFAVIRNPLSALASWHTVDEPMRDGHAPAAERFDSALAKQLALMEDVLDRQVCLLTWYFEQYHKLLPPGNILRYEDIVASQGRNLVAITPAAAGLTAPLENKNRNPLYDRAVMERLAEKLIRTEGAIWQFYSKDSITALLNE